MKQLGKLLSFFLIISLGFMLVGCSDSSDDLVPEENAQENFDKDYNDDFDDAFTDSDPDERNEFGETDEFGPLTMQYTNAELYNTVNNQLALRVSFKFTNNSSAPIAFNEALLIEAEQQDRKLVVDENQEVGVINQPVAVGATLEFDMGFILYGLTEVEVNVYEVAILTGETMSFDVYPDILAQP